MPTARHNFPMSPDNMKSRNVALATECADVTWSLNCASDVKLFRKRFPDRAVTKEPHAVLGCYGFGTPAACAAWDVWSVACRKAVPLETRVRMRAMGRHRCTTW